MLYLTVEEVIEINAQILGGKDTLRDFGLLGSAVMRPQTSVFGEDAYPTLTEKAAALMHSLVLNHAFIDANKRTATIALVDFLEINGFRVIWQPSEALMFITEIAEGKRSVPEIAQWLDGNIQALV